MKRLMRLMLGSVAVLVISAASASSALAALPEFKGPMPDPFLLGGKVKLETPTKSILVKCEGGLVGEITGPTSTTGVLNAEHCKDKTLVCTTTGEAFPGQIGSNSLEGTLGYVVKAKKHVGLDLSPPIGVPFISFTCGASLEVLIRGSVIGEVTPVNRSTTALVVKYAATKGIQKVQHLEGGAVDTLEASINGGPYEAIGLTLTAKTGGLAEPIEVAA